MSTILNGIAICRKREDITKVRKRALSALVHNYIQSLTVFKKIKKLYKRDDGFECNRCHKIVKQLQIAHVGETLSSMIDKLLVEYPDDKIEDIYFRLIDIHESPDKLYEICCSTCNTSLEKKANGSG